MVHLAGRHEGCSSARDDVLGCDGLWTSVACLPQVLAAKETDAC